MTEEQREKKRAADREYYRKNSVRLKAYQKKYRSENKEKVAARESKYWHENKERLKEYNKEYREKNAEKLKKKTKEYREANKEKKSAADKRWRENNKDRCKANKKAWMEKNRGRYNEKRREKNLERWEKDPQYRLRYNVRSRMAMVLKRRRNSKSDKTMELLGCTEQQLRKHLETQFTEGMTWDNYGLRGWHIDHIKPCAAFDLSDPEQQKECFHYTNLQPMWAADNIRKGAKY